MTDAVRPVLWHRSPEQMAAGTGTPASIPLSPEIPYINGPDNVEGVVALSDTRLVVVKYADGALYRIDLDPQAPQGRTITPIADATVRLGSKMALDGNRLVVPDEDGLSVVELDAEAARGTVGLFHVTQDHSVDTGLVRRYVDDHHVPRWPPHSSQSE